MDIIGKLTVVKSKSFLILLGLIVMGLGLPSPVVVGTTSAQVAAVEIYPGDLTQTLIDEQEPGTTFLLMPGIHRLASIEPRDGDVIEGMAGAIMSGAKALNQFSFDGRFWVASGQDQQGDVLDSDNWDQEFCEPGYERCIYPEELFFDNQPLRHAASLDQLSPGGWFFDYDADQIYLADDPTGHVVETSVQSYAIVASGDNVTIRNLIIEKYANPALTGAIQGYETDGWRIENVTVQLTHGAGLKIGNNAQVLNSRFISNGQLGMGGEGDNSLVEGNEIAFNNFARFNPSWEAGGTKFVRTHNLIVRNNYVHDNLATGLWTDIDNVDSLIENNLVVHNSRHGIFHEISYAAIIRNNVSMYNGNGSAQNFNGAQIQITTSPDVEVYGNRVVVDAPGGIGLRISHDDRWNGSFGPRAAVNNHVHDNLIIYVSSDGRSGFDMEGNPTAQEVRESNNVFDRNTYYVADAGGRYWEWGGSQINWTVMRLRGQESNGRLEVFETLPADLVAIPVWNQSSGATP